MAKSLYIAMFVSIVMFFMANSISSKEIGQYSQEAPGDVKISPTSDFDIYSGHHYTHKQLGFLEACFQNLNSLDCGDNIFKNMLDEAAQVLSNECCHDLLKISKDCYLGMTQSILSSYEYRFIASKAIPKSKQTWNDCVLRVGNLIGSPIAFEELH
ncbi:BnaA05g27000D [Brassica napus]|uniref:BnaA05g27000D protein n=1 Tax=Brassica napus TaxID=3708 RepID=A0A078F5Y7_BRANA|nr:BnaA05g27000D [Brassica napus]